MDNCINTLLFGEVCDACDGGAVFKVVSFFLKVISAGVLVLAVIGIIICGVMLLSARDNAGQVAKAKKRMIEIIIGIVVYALMFTIANFIIPGGIVESTLDSSTSSCPKPPELPDPTNPGGGSDPSDPGGGEDPGTGGDGSVLCPRNKNRQYYEQPNLSNYRDIKDKYYKSIAKSTSCPKIATYTKDECGDNMHIDTENPNWCIANTKIELRAYVKYLKDNYIKQDGKTCTTDGTCSSAAGSKDGDQCYKPPSGSIADYKARVGNLCDWGACGHMSNTFASNLNNGEVVSNDAFAAQEGVGDWDFKRRLTYYGTTEMTYSGRTGYYYNDGLTPYANNGNWLTALRNGKVSSKTVYSVRNGGQHVMVIVGYHKSCIGQSSCSWGNTIVLNTDNKVETGTASGYK